MIRSRGSLITSLAVEAVSLDHRGLHLRHYREPQLHVLDHVIASLTARRAQLLTDVLRGQSQQQVLHDL